MNTVFNTKPVRRGPVTEREKIHEFLEREGRPEAAQIRDWIENWYSRLPREKQSDIRGRLRSGETDRFTEAYFELQLFGLLKTSGHEVLSLSYAQLEAFAGNMLELRNRNGEHVFAMSRQAWDSLDATQQARLEAHGQIVAVPIDNIERAAGGSVRCMLAEIHLPRAAS